MLKELREGEGFHSPSYSLVDELANNDDAVVRQTKKDGKILG